MKLQTQLNLAFTALLFVVMAVTGYVLYSLVLGLLIQDEERQLAQKGELLVHMLNEDDVDEANINQFKVFLEEQDLQVFLYNRKDNSLLFSSESEKITKEFIKQNDFSDNQQNLWEYGKNKFVASRILFYPDEEGLELILLTPLNDLQHVQESFIMRMFVVFVIGGIVAILLSTLFTRKLVTPLSNLKKELKKVERRQFGELTPIHATGEIKEVEKSVYEMADELNQYILAQQAFFQNASHELKTPLMTIQGYAEGIRDGIFDQEEKDKGLDVMVKEVHRLKSIINEMTILAKLDTEDTIGKRTNVSLANLLENVEDRIIPFLEDKDLKFTIDIEKDVAVYVNRNQLLQSVLNITSNAVRYAKSEIVISVIEEKGLVKLAVADDGPGIPQKLQPYIFHRFVKGKDGDTGLGLAIAKAMIESSGGKIHAGVADLGGALFEIELPLAKK